MTKPATLFVVLLATATVGAQISYDRLRQADREPQNWLTYSGSYASQRHSLLTQITPANVKNLEMQWVFQARSLERFQATALVVDGILYTVQAPNDILALDAATGRVFWTYSYRPAPTARPCSRARSPASVRSCGPVTTRTPRGRSPSRSRSSSGSSRVCPKPR